MFPIYEAAKRLAHIFSFLFDVLALSWLHADIKSSKKQTFTTYGKKDYIKDFHDEGAFLL